MREEIEGYLDDLLEVHSTMVVARINASRCGTSWDYKMQNLTEEKFLEVKDQVIARLLGQIAGGG